MELTELTWKIIILFVPGIITVIIIDYLTEHREWPLYKFIIYSFVLGVSSYAVLQLLIILKDFTLSIFNKIPFELSTLTFWDTFVKKDSPVLLKEIFYTTIVSIFFGYIMSYLINKKLPLKLARLLHITNKFGDDDVWSYFLNSKEVDWVWIRDLDNDLIYEGWVQSFSESEKNREIVIQEVKVYSNENGKLLYEVPALYLSGDSNRFIIELPPLAENKKKE